MTVNKKVGNRGMLAGHVQAVSGLQRLVEFVQGLQDLVHSLVNQCLALIIKHWCRLLILLISDGVFDRNDNFLEA